MAVHYQSLMHGIDCSCEYITKSALYAAHALTRKNKGELDSIALDEVDQIFICTLDEVTIQCSYTVHSSNSCGVFC